MSPPPAQIINIFETGSKDDIAEQLGLCRIRISFQHLEQNEKRDFILAPRLAEFVFVVQGGGQLAIGSQSAKIDEWDCFGFPAIDKERKFQVTASTSGAKIVRITDKNERTELSKGPEFPSIIHSLELAKPSSKGFTFRHVAQLTRNCDIQQKDKANTWNVNLEKVAPGSKTSEAHAHSHEEEFALLLKGQPRYWHHGQVPSTTLNPGDCVGWKAGTGVAHCLINDGEHHNEEGEAFYYLIFGEDNPDKDRCWYPDLPPESSHWKEGRPELSWGGASKDPMYPRPKELGE